MAYSYSTMLVSSGLKLPHHRHTGPSSLSLQCVMPCRADRKAVVVFKRKQHEASSNGARLIGYVSLPYISDLLSSELDFVFLEELSAQSGRKGERYRKHGDQCKGKTHGGKE